MAEDRVMLRVEIDGAEWSQQPVRAMSLVFDKADTILVALRKVGAKVALSSSLPMGEDSQFALFLERGGSTPIILEKDKLITHYKITEKDQVIFRRIVPDMTTKIGKKVYVSGTMETPDIPLHKAALDGNKEEIIAQLHNGFSIRFKDMYLQTILHVLVAESAYSSVEWLVTTYPDLEINARDHNGYTALHLAIGAIGGDMGLDMALLLLNHEGIMPQGLNNDGYNAMHLLCMEYKPPCVFNVNKYMDIMQRLMAKGVEANQQGKQGETALHLAAWTGNNTALQFLVKAGAALDLQTRSGQTPLHYAAKAGQSSMFNFLLHKVR
eukprot:TRINITY_DN9512_c0_g1_i2.p1 TRINITY_DN9512_c0_g1~~TRINITY_DN9512_c0_g1_i2.p1  ORF type:complete len:340 (+),score=85.62 TRINITY_DN9512_c0_g1_i2:51-1022(+)